MPADLPAIIATIYRIESTKIVARVARIVGDVGVAEELAQDALVLALEQWPGSGVPDNPGAWLMTSAKNKAIDVVRHRTRAGEKHEALGLALDEEGSHAAALIEAAADDDIGDDMLRLVFTCYHPILSSDGRVALTLRLLGGLTIDEIARAFLVPEPTIAQRVVRAKKTLADEGVGYEVPKAAALEERLGSVLEVLYLIFNEGYSATTGDDWTRPALCEDAQRLARVLSELMPNAGEVHGLTALLELQASRLKARTAPDGSPILLLDQNRALWDHMLIGRGLVALAKAEALARPLGPYALQAEIAACHARAHTPEETSWPRIAAFYLLLSRLTGSPLVELNRAVAVSMADGPAAGLAILDVIASAKELAGYHLLPTVRGDLLAKLGRTAEAIAELEKAARLTRNRRERTLLEERVRRLAKSS